MHTDEKVVLGALVAWWLWSTLTDTPVKKAQKKLAAAKKVAVVTKPSIAVGWTSPTTPRQPVAPPIGPGSRAEVLRPDIPTQWASLDPTPVFPHASPSPSVTPLPSQPVNGGLFVAPNSTPSWIPVSLDVPTDAPGLTGVTDAHMLSPTDAATAMAAADALDAAARLGVAPPAWALTNAIYTAPVSTPSVNVAAIVAEAAADAAGIPVGYASWADYFAASSGEISAANAVAQAAAVAAASLGGNFSDVGAVPVASLDPPPFVYWPAPEPVYIEAPANDPDPNYDYDPSYDDDWSASYDPGAGYVDPASYAIPAGFDPGSVSVQDLINAGIDPSIISEYYGG